MQSLPPHPSTSTPSGHQCFGRGSGGGNLKWNSLSTVKLFNKVIHVQVTIRASIIHVVNWGSGQVGLCESFTMHIQPVM